MVGVSLISRSRFRFQPLEERRGFFKFLSVTTMESDSLIGTMHDLHSNESFTSHEWKWLL